MNSGIGGSINQLSLVNNNLQTRMAIVFCDVLVKYIEIEYINTVSHENC